MKIIQVILFFLASNVLLASATITILSPSTQYYLVAGDNPIVWTYNAATDPVNSPTFSIYLNNEQRAEINKLALANNVGTTLNTTMISVIAEGTGFQIVFEDPLGTTLATSETFEVKPLGTAPTAYSAPTPTPIPSATPSSASPAGSGGAAATSPKSNSSNSVHNYGFGVLVLITLFSVILF